MDTGSATGCGDAYAKPNANRNAEPNANRDADTNSDNHATPNTYASYAYPNTSYAYPNRNRFGLGVSITDLCSYHI